MKSTTPTQRKRLPGPRRAAEALTRREAGTAGATGAGERRKAAAPNGIGAAARRSLLRWFAVAQRDLPWRRPERANDTYAVWVSEVMLQQTRVAAAEAYYLRFLARYPRLADLARAKEAEVLALWSGLGYYRRPRQMLRAARAVLAAGRRELPEDFNDLLALPGFGRYTAGAVLSIARQQRYPAVDGNIRRVLARLAGRALSQAEAEAANRAWLDEHRPGDSNQALMELGATVCAPRVPRCGECPIRRCCRDRGREGMALTARPRRPQERREESYWLAIRGGRVRLRRRPATAAIMPGLWELPRRRAAVSGERRLGQLRHAITYRQIEASVYAPPVGSPPPGQWRSEAECAALALTGLTKKILRRFAAGEQA